MKHEVVGRLSFRNLFGFQKLLIHDLYRVRVIGHCVNAELYLSKGPFSECFDNHVLVDHLLPGFLFFLLLHCCSTMNAWFSSVELFGRDIRCYGRIVFEVVHWLFFSELKLIFRNKRDWESTFKRTQGFEVFWDFHGIVYYFNIWKASRVWFVDICFLVIFFTDNLRLTLVIISLVNHKRSKWIAGLNFYFSLRCIWTSWRDCFWCVTDFVRLNVFLNNWNTCCNL